MDEIDKNKKPKPPVLLQVSATIIIAMGIVGFLFFALTSIYQIYNPDFLLNAGSSQYVHIDIYILIQTLLHTILIVSGYLILRLKRIGFYLFFANFLVLLTSEIFYDNKLTITYLVVGLILIFIFLIYYRRFT